MIRLCEDLAVLRRLCADSPFGCPILSAAEAYGLDKPFALFWTDVHTKDGNYPLGREETSPDAEENGCGDRVPTDASVGAAYSKLDGVVRICGTITDAEEVKAFLGAVGAESVVCSAENAAKLALQVTERGVVLCKDLSAPAQPEAGETPPLRQVYDVLQSCGMVGDFEPFYLDLSHRVRHGTALCTAEYEEEKMAAAAVGVYGAACSLITAVAVRPEYRRQGLGTRVVRRMEERLSGRVYLLRAENENERFYASLGYRPCGAWCAGIL